jgi:hypothetical protein
MRKLMRSIARYRLEAMGYRHLNRKGYNPVQRKGETEDAYKARCARSKAKSAFSLLWCDALAGKLGKKADKVLTPKRGLTGFIKGLFGRKAKEARA